MDCQAITASPRLTIVSRNKRGIRAYKRAGLRVIGNWREARRLGGRAYDIVTIDRLATGLQSPVRHRLLTSD